MSAITGLVNVRARLPLGLPGRVAGRSVPAWDPWLLGSIVALLVLGTIMVHSASVSIAERLTGNSSHYLLRHLFRRTGRIRAISCAGCRD